MNQTSFFQIILVIFLNIVFMLNLDSAYAQKIYLNPSDQYDNTVAGGGNEAEYALFNATMTKTMLVANGFDVKIDQDFYNAPLNANSWGADIFISIHSNAGGGHGTETFYVSNQGNILAENIQDGLMSKLPYENRGVKYGDFYVLNTTNMYACLTEVLFHDCSTQSGQKGHPPSESEYLKNPSGQEKIALGISGGVCSYYNKNCTEAQLPPDKGWFKGVVYEYPNLNDRIAGALVTLNTGQTTVSSPTGFWKFALVPGTYTAEATMEGYVPNSSTKIIVGGQEIWGSIGLTKGSLSDDNYVEDVPDSLADDISESVFPEPVQEIEYLDAVQPEDSATVKDILWPDQSKEIIVKDTEEISEPEEAEYQPKKGHGRGCTTALWADEPWPFSLLFLIFLLFCIVRVQLIKPKAGKTNQ